MDKPSTHQLADPSKSLLLILDIQDRLALSVPGKVLNRVLKNTSLLVRSANILNIPLVVSEHNPAALGATERTISSNLKNHNIFEKTSFSAAKSTDIMNAVSSHNRAQIILAGMEAHICVLQTAIDLMSAGYTVFVVEDSICSQRLENYQNALARLRQSHITTTCAESVVFEWLGDSENPHFKAVQDIIN